MRQTKMSILITFFALLVLALTGCKEDEADGSDTPTVPSEETTAVPELSITDKSVNEGNNGTVIINLKVSCSAQPQENSEVTVHWSTSDATSMTNAKAVAGEDYVAGSGVLTFTKGKSLDQTIAVTVNGDVDLEEDEIFLVTLERPVNATISVGVGEVLIVNDDTGVPNTSSETKFENLPEGVIIADHFDYFGQNDYDSDAVYTTVPISEQNFTEAVQVEIQKTPSSASRVNMTMKSPIQLHQNDIILVSFYARTITPSSNGSGHLEFLLQHNGDPWTEYVSWPIDIKTEWKRYYIPFTVQVWRGMRSEIHVPPPSDGDSTTFGAGEVRFRFSLGYHSQKIQLADMRIVDFGTAVTGDQLPVTILPSKEGNVIIPASSKDIKADWTPDLLAEADAGNRYLPDFSYAGYHNGEESLPDGTGWAVINVIDYGATPDDGTDDTAAIKDAIAAAESISDPVKLIFPAGRFIINDVLIIQKKNFILQGAGSQADGTVIAPSRPMKDMTKPPLILATEQEIVASKQKTGHGDLYSPFSWAGGVIWVGSSDTHGNTAATGTATRTNSTANRGDHTVSTEDASRLSAGQVVQLRYYDNSSDHPLHDHIFDCTASDLPKGYGSSLPKNPEVVQNITVDSVSGNNVTFKEPLNHDIRAGWHCDLKTFDWFTEIGIEGITIEFPMTTYAGHHIEEGYNGIYVNDGLNCWIDDIQIINSDSGVLVENSKNVTIRNIVINGRGGHYALMAANSDQILFRDFQTSTRTCHNLSFNTYARTTVYTHGRVDAISFDQHNGMNHQNLLDDLDLVGEVRHLWEHGGSSSRRPTHGAFNTAWNLRFSPAGQVPVLGTTIDDGPSAYMVGLSSDAMLMFTYGPNTYTEGLGKRDIAVPSLYEYQLERRTTTP
ncbi:hypothetical protein GMJAKD_09120 [Candidatus Electrothrix aarhusensis]